MNISFNTNIYRHVRKNNKKNTDLDQDYLSLDEPWLMMPNDGRTKSSDYKC